MDKTITITAKKDFFNKVQQAILLSLENYKVENRYELLVYGTVRHVYERIVSLVDIVDSPSLCFYMKAHELAAVLILLDQCNEDICKDAEMYFSQYLCEQLKEILYKSLILV